jgi:branched-chain amino acid transport system ATP-binding protein
VTGTEDVLLEVRSLSLHFGGLIALEDASFSVAQGETLGVIGPNGAGKTTLLNCISGLYRYRAGDVLFDGTSIRRLQADKRTGLGVARTFQSADYFAEFSALDFVLLSRLRFQRKGLLGCTLGLASTRRSERDEARRALEFLDRFGLADISGQPLGLLPYGTRKTLDIVRATLSEPKLLLLDEPTSGTTMEDRESLLAILTEISVSERLTTVVVDHDVAFVTALCNQLLVMNSGRILAFGNPAELLARPDVISAYIGVEI